MTSLELAGEPFPFGLTFVSPEVLGALGGAVAVSEAPSARLAAACETFGASFAFVSSADEWSADAVRALDERGVATMWVVDGPLWPVVRQHGAIAGLRATLTDPERIGRAIDERLDVVLEGVAAGARLGARAIVLAEDLAGSAGPLIAPDFAIAELLPRYARIVQAAGALGICCVLHSDGDVRPLLPAIARAGFVAIHAGGGLDFERFDKLFWAARGAGLAVIGGLLTRELGHEIRAEAIGSTIGVVARAGGLLVADDGGITTRDQVRHLASALRAARAV